MAANLNQTIPALPPPNAVLLTPAGTMNTAWYIFLTQLLLKFTPTAIGQVLTSIADNGTAWAAVSGQSFAAQAKNTVFAGPASGAPALPTFRAIEGADFGAEAANAFLVGPSSGSAAAPTFRAMATADLDSVRGQIPGTATNNDASAGNVGEYIFDEIDAAHAVSMANGSPTDIALINLSAGDWDVWGNFVSDPASLTTQSSTTAWLSTASATDPGPPNNGAYVLSTLSVGAGLSQTTPVGMMRVSLAAAGKVYLSATVAFSVGVLSGYGFIGARRAR